MPPTNDEDKTHALLAEIHQELTRKHPWYARSPFKDMFTHAVTVIVAISFGYALHILTGAPLTIEAKNDDHKILIPLPAATAEAPALSGEAMSITDSPVPAVEASASPSTSPPTAVAALASAGRKAAKKKPPPVVPTDDVPTALAYAPAPSASSPPAASSSSSRSATAAPAAPVPPVANARAVSF